MSAVVFPPKITVAQLKSLARLCGSARSGTKTALQERLVNDLKGFTPLPAGTRVLSIDLGIRNLAYSLLEVPGADAVPAATPVQPILHAWERIALIPKIPKPAPAKSKKKSKAEPEPDAATIDGPAPKPKRKSKQKAIADEATEEERQAEAAATAEDPVTMPVLFEDFSPTRLSQLAVELATARILPLRPDVVIIEEQRFRSRSSMAVFEWTLRVNSLECMIYAVLATMRALGRWPGGRLEGIVALNVLDFMAVQEGDGNGGTADIRAKAMKGDNKKLKKDIVGRMLRARSGVRIAEEAVAVAELAEEYLEKWERNGKRGRAGTMNVKKTDDLADCLLQGIAFIRWQENKSKLLAGGVGALEDQMATG